MPFGGVTVKDVPSHDFVKALAEWLKKSGKIKLPDYVDYAKTAKHKELAPYDRDWYYVRAASVVRHIYLRRGVGVGGLQKVYGGRKRRGTRPGKYVLASASVHRHVLQQLEKMKLIEQDDENGGRRITSKGQKDLDQIAGQVISDKKK
jgi:small subunit ribosomal protein S19e